MGRLKTNKTATPMNEDKSPEETTNQSEVTIDKKSMQQIGNLIITEMKTTIYDLQCTDANKGK